MFIDNGTIKGFCPIKTKFESKGWEFLQNGSMKSSVIVRVIKQTAISQRSKNIGKNGVCSIRFHPFGEYCLYPIGKKFRIRLYKHFFKQDTDLLASTATFRLLQGGTDHLFCRTILPIAFHAPLV